MFNHLPTHIKNVANKIQVFKKTLKKFVLDNSFFQLMNILMLEIIYTPDCNDLMM
jgi:hypothetical protein